MVAENGANIGFWDFENFGHTLSVVYQPVAMRWRGVPVLTNTPARGPQRGPGENQTALAMEPILDKAARQLKLDRVAIRLINAPDSNGKHGEKQLPMTSAFLKDALEKGAARFKWEEKTKLSGQRRGSKVIGVGVGSAFHPAGQTGFDGLVRITPDGKTHIHTGVGNLGTYSYAGTARVAAEVLKANWDNCILERGDSRKHLPWNSPQVGSNTSFTQSRTNYVAAMDAKEKLLQVAAKDLGGKPEDYDIGGEKVFLKSDPSKSLTYAKAAQRAIELGGAFSGKEAPGDLNPITKASVAALAGTGLIGVAKDKLPIRGMPPALAAGFMMIELDVETGKWTILEYIGVADCGTVIHPHGSCHPGQGWRRDGGRLGCDRALCARRADRDPGQCGAALRQAGELPRRAGRDGMGRGRQSRPERAARIARHRRAAARLRRRRTRQRHRGRDGRPLFQPHACGHGHDRERDQQASAGPQAACCQHVSKGRRHGSGYDAQFRASAADPAGGRALAARSSRQGHLEDGRRQ